MKSSLIWHVKLSPRSAAIYLGTTEGEIFNLYNNSPPERISIGELYNIAGDKLKAGSHDATWFNSALAQVDPILANSADQLVALLNLPEIHYDFRTLISIKPTIGTAIEVLRIIVNKYESVTGPLYDFVERL